jgi:glycosyltransferase involved in cell wall biosynthesis
VPGDEQIFPLLHALDCGTFVPNAEFKLSYLPSNSTLSATVVVCTRNRAQQLDCCLQALTRLRYPNYEILVVENGTPDLHTRQVAERYGTRYMNSPVVGLSRARNEGARNCNTDLIAFTDDDAVPCEDWLMNLAREFCEPSIMAVAGEMVSPPVDGMPASPLQPPASDCNRGLQQARVVGQSTPNWFSLTNFGGIGDGCNMCFRQTAFEHWPGFDERLGRGAILNSAEEHLSFFELVLRGYQCVHTPHAVVQHPCPIGTEAARRFHRKNLINAVAYAGLLWAEYPETRGMLFRHLWSRSFGQRKRTPVTQRDRTASFSFVEQLGIILAGIHLFWKIPRALRRRSDRST